jgi:hypothetical protein
MHISNLQAPAQCRSAAFADYFAVFFFAAAFFVDLPVAYKSKRWRAEARSPRNGSRDEPGSSGPGRAEGTVGKCSSSASSCRFFAFSKSSVLPGLHAVRRT